MSPLLSIFAFLGDLCERKALRARGKRGFKGRRKKEEGRRKKREDEVIAAKDRKKRKEERGAGGAQWREVNRDHDRDRDRIVDEEGRRWVRFLWNPVGVQ